MALWLCKQEPSCYSYSDLVRDGATLWDGVANPLARRHLREMKPGDRVFYYHTGKEKAIVGEMIVSGGPLSNGTAEDKNAVAVPMKAGAALPSAVRLSQIKADPVLSKSDLVRLPRLSVLPVSKAQWERVMKLAKEAKASAK